MDRRGRGLQHGLEPSYRAPRGAWNQGHRSLLFRSRYQLGGGGPRDSRTPQTGSRRNRRSRSATRPAYTFGIPTISATRSRRSGTARTPSRDLRPAPIRLAFAFARTTGSRSVRHSVWRTSSDCRIVPQPAQRKPEQPRSRKSNRLKELWPELKVIPWPAFDRMDSAAAEEDCPPCLALLRRAFAFMEGRIGPALLPVPRRCRRPGPEGGGRDLPSSPDRRPGGRLRLLPTGRR